jgi:hypothetical protein
VERDAAREQPPQQFARESDHDRVGVGRHRERTRLIHRLAVAIAEPHRDRARPDAELARGAARAAGEIFEHALELERVGGVAMERRLARNRERDLALVDDGGVAPAAAFVQQPPGRAEQRLEHFPREQPELADRAQVHRAERLRVRVADARELVHRQIGEERLGVTRRDAGEAVGLDRLAHELGEHAIRPSPHVTVSPVASKMSRLRRAAAASRSRCSRSVPLRSQ